MENQKREPKGTKAGGQFAASANPESTALVLESADGSSVTVAVSRHIDLTEPVKTNSEAVAWCEAEIERVEAEYNAMVEGGHALDPDAEELRDYIDELRDELVDHQRELIAELSSRQSALDLEGSVAARIVERIGPWDYEEGGYDKTVARVRALLDDMVPDYEVFDDAIGAEASEVMVKKRDELVAIFGEFEW